MGVAGVNRGPGFVVNPGPGVVVNPGPTVGVFRATPSQANELGNVSDRSAGAYGLGAVAPLDSTFRQGRSFTGYAGFHGGRVYRGAPGRSAYGYYPYNGVAPVFFAPTYQYIYITSAPVVAPAVAPAEPQPAMAQPAEQAPAAGEATGEPVRAAAGREPVAGRRAAEGEPKRGVARLEEEDLHELMIRGTRAFEAGDFDEAGSCFLRVAMADRENVDATLAYAIARFATGDYQVSALAIRRGIRRMPEIVRAPFDIRARYSDKKVFYAQLTRLEDYVTDHPGQEDGWLVLGFIRHFSDQAELAARTFELLKWRDGENGEVAAIFLQAAETQPTDDPPASSGDGMVPPADADDGSTSTDSPLPPPVADADNAILITVDAVE